MLKLIWQYLSIYQTKFTRIIHLAILILVLVQLISSNWMGFTKNGLISPIWYKSVATWCHIVTGCILLLLLIIFIISCLKHRGFYYFFPYLKGDFSQIKSDIRQLLSFKLPESLPRGLATSVQGLGLAALTLVIVSGVVWFLCWLTGSPLAANAKHIHKGLTILIEIYIVGHGAVGILHFLIWYQHNRLKTN